MPELNSPIKERVEDIYMTQVEEKWNQSDWKGAIALLSSAWNLLPGEKGHWDESYHIAKDLIEFNLKEKNFSDALKWAETIYSCDKERIDSGEREFLHGKVLFESGSLDKAREQFKIAMQKSEGRAFEGEPKKYIDLLKKK